jgi:competence protein ComEC
VAFVTTPAFFAALAFAAGIGLAQAFYRPPACTLLAAAFGCCAALFCSRVAPWLALCATLLAWLCAGMFCAQVEPRPAASTPLRAALLDSDTAHGIVAIVLPATQSRPQQDEFNARHTSRQLDVLLLAIDQAPLPARNIARLTMLEAEQAAGPACGATLTFVSKLHAPPRYYTPGAWDEAAWLAEQGIFAEGSVHAAAMSVRPAAHVSLPCRLAALRQQALDHMDSVVTRMSGWPSRWQFAALTPQDASLLAAAILGDRSRLDPAERTAFQRVGAFHLLVVSGLGIAILAGMLWRCLRKLRLNRLLATVATLALLTGYAALTGFNPPVQRALLMTAVYMAGRLLHRAGNPLNTLSVAAVWLLAASPSALLGSSLQMTLLAVFAIAGIASPLLANSTGPWLRATRGLHLPLDASLPSRLAQFRVTLRMWQRALRPLLGHRFAGWATTAIPRTLLRLCELAAISFTLQLALAVPLAVYFHRVIALSAGANLLTVPLLALLLPVAVLTFILSYISTSLALVPAALTAALLNLAATAVHCLALLPSAEWRTAPTRPAAIVLAMVCLLLATTLAARPRRINAFAACVLTVLAGALALWPVPLRLHANALEITALDVGQGDAIFVAAPDGQTLLVDAGGPYGPFNHAGAGDFFGEDIVSPYLWQRGLRRLDAVALTHAHSDHMGGMSAVLRNFRPKELWIGADPPIPAFQQLIQLAESLHIPVRTFHAGDAFSFGGANLAVLAPPADYVPGAEVKNDDSLVLHIGLGRTSALLEGDAQTASEQAMLASPRLRTQLQADLLKVGHHGSLSSTTPPFLEQVRPAWAIVSAGRHNLFGHPRPAIVQRLEEAHARVYRTDMDGAASFLLDGTTVVSIAP